MKKQSKMRILVAYIHPGALRHMEQMVRTTLPNANLIPIRDWNTLVGWLTGESPIDLVIADPFFKEDMAKALGRMIGPKKDRRTKVILNPLVGTVDSDDGWADYLEVGDEVYLGDVRMMPFIYKLTQWGFKKEP